MKRVFFAALFLLGFISNSFAAEYPWRLKKNEQGIQVRVRKVEDSPILEYKGTVVVDASMDKVVAFYEDTKRMTEWFHQCSESKMLEQKSPDDKILYFAIRMPWPVSDRDSVYERVRTKDPATGAMEYHASVRPNVYPLQNGRIRMPRVKGIWRFTPLPDGRTEVYYQQHGDVGGYIPAWLVNQLAVNIPFNTLLNLRRLLTSKN